MKKGGERVELGCAFIALDHFFAPDFFLILIETNKKNYAIK